MTNKNPLEQNIVISARNVGKTFYIQERKRDKVKRIVLNRRISETKKIAALDEVSFDIKRGDSIGIIGKNGSGKSTILQIICGTLSPTSGEIEVYGKIAALLELGSGFNPDFTGRENIEINAILLGMSKKELGLILKMSKFAEIGIYIDQPVRTYSSGMIVRLAFAIVHMPIQVY